MSNKEPGIVLVKRKGVDGPVRVDEAEYNANPDAFELWDDAPAKTTTDPKTTDAPQYLVRKIGKLYKVVDMDGAVVTDVDGINAAGYHSEAEAWTAIAALAGKA